MGARAARAVMVADSSKIGRAMFATLSGGADVFSTLITDAGITDEQREQFAENGFEVIVA
jgi:DeoR family transcriptional regulator of aga operon